MGADRVFARAWPTACVAVIAVLGACAHGRPSEEPVRRTLELRASAAIDSALHRLIVAVRVRNPTSGRRAMPCAPHAVVKVNSIP